MVELIPKETDFLDLFLSLQSGKYSPYRKPNNTPLYINARSNHPPPIIKQLPKMIESRLSSLSYDQEVFDNAKGDYVQALQNSGFDGNLEYTPQVPDQQPKRKRQRKVIWFNPPFNQGVKTDIAAKFLSMIPKFFPKNHPYKKLFNRHTLKVSYSCTPNMAAIISGHNAQVLTPPKEPNASTCNCRNPDECPLDNKCLIEAVVYKAAVSTPNKPEQVYYGQTGATFKKRYYGHDFDLSHPPEDENSGTSLSRYVWGLKESGKAFDIAWSIEKKCAPYRCGSRRCDVCISEKAVIAMADPSKTLNSRSEIVSGCRHRARFKYIKVIG